jgi:hypothetical protein
MTSPFAATADRYRERGLSVIPCGPGTKFPGAFSAAQGWRTAFDWQKYCDRLPTPFETSIWDRWPDAGVCLALGRSSAPAGMQLVAADIDTEEAAEVAAIRAVLPGSPVRKRGAKGETEFYLAPIEVPNRPYNDGQKRRMLDLLCHGRQTVLPPTIHPDCQQCGARATVAGADAACGECGGVGQAYRWTSLDTLENFDIADLPVLPEDIADRLSKALEPFGHVDAPTVQAADPEGEASTHRQLNDTALASLGAWVPALGLYKCRQVGGKYKAVSHWRPSSSGRPLSQRATNLAISPDGIKDCGEGRGYTPIDLVMCATGADLDTAFRWLQERVAPAAPIMLTARVKADVPPTPEPARTGNLAGLRLATFLGAPVQPDVIAEVAGPARATAAGLIPIELCTPPGLIGEIVEWMNAADDRPSPQMNLGAAIGFVGALMGRRFAHPSKGARTNFYCVGVAPTGFGKAHAPLAVKELAKAAGVDGFIGPGRWKSESAVRKTLEAKPTVVCLVDELGGVMRDILGKKASEHKAGIRDILLELFSSANTTYSGAEGAAERAVPIVNPNLCIYGASTPEDLWGNFSSGSAADGFLPRWLVFDGGTVRPEAVDATADVFDPPADLRKRLHGLLDVRPAGNLNGVANSKPITATWGEGAQEFFKALRAEKERAIDAARAAGRNSEAMILSRFVEHAVKLSLLYAVSIHAPSPTITVAGLEWARAICEFSASALVQAMEGRIADNDRQAEYLAMLSMIRDAGVDGLLESALTKRVRGRWDIRRHEDILGQLKAGGVIWREVRAGPAGGRPGARVGVWRDEEREAL